VIGSVHCIFGAVTLTQYLQCVYMYLTGTDILAKDIWETGCLDDRNTCSNQSLILGYIYALIKDEDCTFFK